MSPEFYLLIVFDSQIDGTVNSLHWQWNEWRLYTTVHLVFKAAVL